MTKAFTPNIKSKRGKDLTKYVANFVPKTKFKIIPKEVVELAIKHIKYDVSQKNVLLLGAGGVSPSIIFALNNMKAKRIFISNRTRSKAENLKKIFSEIEIVEWGALPDLDMIINATSLGLKNDEKINLEYSKIGSNKLFYDVIYNPAQTNFLKSGKDTGNKTENGMKLTRSLGVGWIIISLM